MKACVRDNRYIYLEEITDAEILILWEEFTFDDPNSRYYADKDRPWQGKQRKFDRFNLRLRRTFLGRLVFVCKKHNLPLTIEDYRPRWKHTYVDKSLIDNQFLPDITLEDYQVEGITAGVNSECGIFKLTTGLGKCLGKDTPVMMFDGSTKMVQDIRVGELLMGDDSKPRQVKSVCQGSENLYRVDQIYGDSYVVNESHILSFMKTPVRKGQKREKVDLKVLDYLNSTKTDIHRLKGYKAEVNFPEKSVRLDPYYLGLWLGDGIASDTSFCLHEEDGKEIIESLKDYASSIGCIIQEYDEPSKANIYAIRLYEGVKAPEWYKTFQENPFRSSLKFYDLVKNKHVPDDYIFNSREVRLQVLAGLIDSDGEMSDNCYVLNMKSRKIIESACFIARSLGFRATVTPNHKSSQTGYVGLYWKLCISGHTNFIPVKVSYKKATPRAIKKSPLVHGIELTELGEGEYFGFEIDGNKRFLLGDFTVTHNTEIICGLCKAINCPTLILADMTIVVAQLRDRLKLREVASEIGMFFAGQKPNGEQIVCGSIQSLNPPKALRDPPVLGSYKSEKGFKLAQKRWESSKLALRTRTKNYKYLTDYVKKAEMVIVDECDRASSKTYNHVLRRLYNGRRRYGFSATPFDDAKPLNNINIEENFGYVLIDKDRHVGEARGRIVPLKYRTIVYEDSQYELHNKITLEDSTNIFMTESAKFHDLCYGLVNYHYNERNMILIDRIQLGQNLLNYFRKKGLKAEFIYGKTSNPERDRIIKEFAGGRLDVLIGGKIVNRGLDVKGGIDNLICAIGGKLSSDFLQKIGRAVRVNERGYSNVYDFFFRCNHYLYNHSKARLETIIKSGYESKVLFGYATLNGEEFKKRSYRKPPRPNKKQGKQGKKLF